MKLDYVLDLFNLPSLPAFWSARYMDFSFCGGGCPGRAKERTFRGLDFAEADKIKEHAEIILSMVKNDCEALLLQESTSSANLCKLRGALIHSEKWSLPLKLSTKYSFKTSGVMAAWEKSASERDVAKRHGKSSPTACSGCQPTRTTARS
ncbi:hypothetical protein quinque_002404 [Culex quinquefasciatus]